MYLRPIHTENDPAVLYDFIKSNPLGIIITALPSSDSSPPSIQLSHIPWVLELLESSPGAGMGKLRGHMARANPQTKTMLAASERAGTEVPVTVLFNGPASHYVTPKFYVETKPSTGKVVPTWNYAAVQITGKATFHTWSSSDFLHSQVDDLSEMCEEMYSEGENWKVSDAPVKYTDMMKKAIVGVEVEITGLEGKFKMSQEDNAGDRAGLVAGFEATGTDVGRQMAQCIHARAPQK